MIPIPAIDLKDGKVVRLLQGNFKEEKVYFDSPEKIAKHFEDQGAQRIHVVDLNGALGGKPKNLRGIEKILKTIRVPIEVGGGIHDLKTVERYFDLGISWVVLGTKACLDKGFMREAFEEFNNRIIIGLDAKNGFVATDGWTNITKVKAVDLARQVQEMGGQTVIYTDIATDGVLKGPNLPELEHFVEKTSLHVIASGGVGSLKDLEALKKLNKKNIVGAIIGKALYEKKFTLAEAIKVCSQSE